MQQHQHDAEQDYEVGHPKRNAGMAMADAGIESEPEGLASIAHSRNTITQVDAGIETESEGLARMARSSNPITQ
eukprot:6481483-Amphidinium_carterae.1